MKLIDGNATNLTELWWSEEKQRILTVNGFHGNGSDYERFRAFCVCMERMKGSPEELAAREELKRLLNVDSPLNRATCNAVWHEAANRLVPWGNEEQPSCGSDVPIPAVEYETVAHCAEVCQAAAENWEQWACRAREFVNALPTGVLPLLRLREELQWKKPDLYHVNRHLSREEPNEALWESEVAVFLLKECYDNGRRLAIRAHCDTARLQAFLNSATHFTPLPRLLLLTEDVEVSKHLPSLCQRILDGQREEGIPPVRIVWMGELAPLELPPHLLCELGQ